MRQDDIIWVRNNMLLLTTSRRYEVGELQRIFDIYNNITGEKKKTTSCGRCIETVKKRIKLEYDKERN